MADILYSILEHFSITKRLLYITTNNARNNGMMQKELKELLNNLDINNSWSSDSTKIPCLAHVIQLIVKAILGAFNVKLAEKKQIDNNINSRSVCSMIAKVRH